MRESNYVHIQDERLRCNIHEGLRFDVQGNRTTTRNLQNHWRINLLFALSQTSQKCCCGCGMLKIALKLAPSKTTKL